MRNFVPIAMLLAASVCAQAPDQKRGVVDGRPVNQAQLEALINLVPEQARGGIVGNPEELLRYYGFITRMTELADKAHLAEQSPYKEQLELGRKTVLAVAMMAEYSKTMDIPTAEVDKYYQAHKDEFTTANITVVQVPVKSAADLDAAKTKAQDMLQKARAGADFGAMAKQFPVEGDFRAFKKSDAIPADIKDAVFALQAGQITSPLARANAVFLIRLDSLAVKPLQDARGDVLKTMQDAKYQAWMNGVRASVVIGK